MRTVSEMNELDPLGSLGERAMRPEELAKAAIPKPVPMETPGVWKGADGKLFTDFPKTASTTAKP